MPQSGQRAESDDALAPVQSPLLSARLAGTALRHGFFTRRGGVSSGIYESLNCGAGSDDRPEDVAENRARVAGWFGEDVSRLVNLHQCHSADAIAVDAPFAGERPRADALVTKTPGLVLGVLTADCGPVLFADPTAGVIGAAHAGWRGALGGVLEATLAAMMKLGARREAIGACLGPSIGRRAYEVGPEFVARFTEEDKVFSRFFSPSGKEGHALFDLAGFIGLRLDRAGIAHDIMGQCTYENEQDFFSYRRSTHRGEPDYGRQISAISIAAS
ncbi:peptidoglycan editing factor PgeF [Martelella lutilitoris]|uniref:Purine nucleoside phosphorylase n=1 Tax=Martelella lutilitoris TaxID=2583532 RepID=A0A5C4JV72_9HYPH|nr:peptidoglycan editing factor PgeF [Martelella lutilitoris]TNB49343.1 peptidoglycan editing factor PgeF [Martelella lutilitoris]